MLAESAPRDAETTPLLSGTSSSSTIANGHHHDDDTEIKKGSSPSWLTRVVGPVNTIKVLFAGFLISTAFSFTQVSIFYVFHLMECEIYYDTHPVYAGRGDRCAVNDIAARTATQFSLLGMSTTFCGTLNLFITGWTIKRWGPCFALVLQTLIPALRTCCQIVGILAGGAACITIIQATQLVTILGGPAGYILVVNTIAGELVAPAQRTAVFGQLQGCIMLGQAIGLFLGGYVGDTYGVRMPFNVAFFLLLTSSVYAGLVLPYIDPASLTDRKPGAKGKSGGGVGGFLAPLKIMAPQRVRYASGRVGKHYGVLFLCCGIFLGVLATGYAPLLIQMYATAYFDFSQGDNGWLMSGNALMRSFFLFFIFPPIISVGRKWWVAREKAANANKPAGSGLPPSKPKKHRRSASSNHDDDDDEYNGLARIPSRPEEIEAPMAGNRADQEEPTPSPQQGEDWPEEERAACRFDLFFLRWSLLVDGILTVGAALCTEKWQIFLGKFTFPRDSPIPDIPANHDPPPPKKKQRPISSPSAPARPPPAKASSPRCAPIPNAPTPSTP